MIKVAVIGAGAMGSKHARTVAESGRAELAVIVDADGARAQRLAEAHGGRWTTSVEHLSADAAIVATPTTLHSDIAMDLLDGHHPILVEKPLASDLSSAAAMLRRAEERNVPMTCGFVERWNPAVRTALDLLEGPVMHMMSVRHSPPAPRIETDVVVDLMIHDLDLATRIFEGDAISVGSNAHTPVNNTLPEIADCSIRFAGGLASCSTSRIAQRKVRSVTLAVVDQMIEIDLIRQDVTIFQHVRHEMTEAGAYRADTIIDIPVPRHHGEPLARQFRHFVDLVDGRVDAAAERATLLRPHQLMDAVLSTAGIA